MEFNVETVCRLTKRIGNKQLMTYSQILRNNLLEAGIDRSLAEDILKRSIKEFRRLETYIPSCHTALEGLSQTCSIDDTRNRGIDPIGRIVVKYCFNRTSETRILWSDDSEQDNKSREVFTEGVIARPLMRYFLVSVRGTMYDLNKFEAGSVLFGTENTIQEERKSYIDEILKEFSEPETETIDWKRAYQDSRLQKLALELIGEIRRKIAKFGHDRYLRILDNFHQRDPDNKGINAMHRSFTPEDIQQIDDALWSAEEALADKLT